MKKLCAVCMMLAVAISMAFAGNSYQKEAPVMKMLDEVNLEKALIKYEEGLELTDAEKAAVVDYLGLDRGTNGEVSPLDAQGGPNVFGYRWVDNQGGDTATFSWIQLDGDPAATSLTAINNNDDAARPCTLSWNFPYYAGSYNIIRPATNGQIALVTNNTSFTNACGGTFTSQTMPVIFAFWDDWDTRAGGLGGVAGSVSDSGRVLYRDFGTHAVIQWDSIGRSSAYNQNAVTFQAILYPNGKIKVQWFQINGTTNPSATVGIKDANSPGPLDYLQYICNTVADPTQAALAGRAVWFYRAAAAPGRCCYLQGGVGACADLLPDACTALGGQFAPGTSCAAAPCPTGRCCYVQGGADRCATNTQLECNFLAGTWTAGQNCNDNPCPVGRCCYNGGASCANVSQQLCTQLAGTWAATLLCETAACPVELNGSDLCTDAVGLTIGQTVVGNNSAATPEVGVPLTCGSGYNTSAKGVWYKVIGTGNTMTVTTCEPSVPTFDTEVFVFCGGCAVLTCIGGNDDAACAGGSGLTSTFTWCSQLGSEYLILATAFSTGQGVFPITVRDDGIPCSGAINCLPIGRCCYRDATGVRCADITAPECEVLGGSFDALTTCADGGPCAGSCCYVVQGEGFCGDEGFCADGLLRSECAALGGTWTAGGTCVDNPCPPANPCVCQCSTFPNSHGILAVDETTYPILDLTNNSYTINVPIEYQITDLNVCIDAIHTFDGDVEISITSPMGTTVMLSDNRGSGSDNWFCTEFDDEAVNAVATGFGPFTGSWIPDAALSAFDGQNAVGNWTISFNDVVGGDFGYIIGVCLKFEYDIILPVAFGSFDAVAGNSTVTLNWNTESESNVANFEVQRDGVKIAEVAAQNSATGATYRYVDAGLTNGVVYNYSLVAVDVDGNRATLATLSATPTASAVITEYALHQNYPNPFNPTTSISFDMVEAGKVTINVYNIMGQKVAEIANGAYEAGRHVVSFNAAGLSSGLYLYKMEANGFTAQSKMVLMK